MPARKIVTVILMEKGTNPLNATPEFEYRETPNGVVMLHGRSAQLIPWHRIYEVEYARV